MNRDQFVSIFFIALLIFIIYEIFLIFSPFLEAMFWAGILAFAFHPIYLNLRERLAPRENLAAVLMTIAICLVVIIPVSFIIVNVAGQAIDLYQTISFYIREGKVTELIDRIRAYPPIQSLEQSVLVWQPIQERANEWVLSGAQALGNFGTVQAGLITKNFFFIALNTFLTFILLFVFLKDGENIYRFVYYMAPFEPRNKKYIFTRINETFSAVIRGQLLTAATQGIVTGMIFWILQLPAPVFFGAFTFIAAMIPVIGASFVWFPVVCYLYINHDYSKATFLLVFGVLVISLIDNAMKPALIGKKAKLPYFLLFFGVMGGMKLYGLMGAFLAPVVLSLFFALIKIYQEKYIPHE